MTELELLGADAELLEPDALAWGKQDGLLPAIVQDATTYRVLMLGYMDREALNATLATRKATFFSRSRARLWTKGETSGNFLEVVRVAADCDRDTLLVVAHPLGHTCHLGTASCFSTHAASSMIRELDTIVAARDRTRPADSYTTKLLESGIARIAQKVGEEGVETALAAVTADDAELLGEAADLVYHLSVLLRARGLDWSGVEAVLGQRHRQAGS